MRFFSVVIPAFNEAKVIRQCLQSLRGQSYPESQFEIVVVDNGSSDSTVSISKEYTSKVFVLPRATIAAMRNYGVEQAIGDTYAFLDADCVADRDWLSNAAEALDVEECVVGSKYDVPDDAHWIEAAWFAQKPKGRQAVTYVNSGNMIVPAWLYRTIGGFDESLKTGEDYEMCLRAQKVAKVMSDDRVRVTHLGNPKSLQAFVKREIWHGLGGLDSLRHKWTDLPLFGTFAFILLSGLQVAGLVRLALIGTGDLIAGATAGIILLLAATAFYRSAQMRNFRSFAQLAVLYYAYYLGRSISLFYILKRQHYFRVK